jgi:hypothetical protein
LFVPLVALISGLMPRCTNSYPMVIEALNACEAAVEVLGPNIRQRPLGMSCGSSEVGCSSKNASWSFPVAGDLARGTVSYRAEAQGAEPWSILSATLEVRGKTISVVPCMPVPRGGGTTVEPLRFGLDLPAVVTRIDGEMPASPGDACRLRIIPNPDFTPELPFNCKVEVRCEGTLFYGWGESGYLSCSQEGGRVTGGTDPYATRQDRDPALEMDLLNKTVVVREEGEGAFRMELRVDTPDLGPEAPLPRPGADDRRP